MKHRSLEADEELGMLRNLKNEMKELYHRHYWISDTRIHSGWHIANNDMHAHPEEEDIEYQYRVSEYDHGRT